VSLILIAAGLGLVIMPGLVRRVGRYLDPAVWSRLCLVSLIWGTVLVEFGLVLCAAPTVLRAFGGTGLALLCQEALGNLVPGGPVVAWFGAVFSLAIGTAAISSLVAARREERSVRIEAGLGLHQHQDHYELVVLPTALNVAVSVDGTPNQVVISEGLVQVLSDQECASVIAHEVAHLRHGHHRMLVMASIVDRGFCRLPLVHRSVQALRCGIERWADEAVVAEWPEARTHLRSALVKVTLSALGPSMAAFSDGDAVLERLRALESSQHSNGASAGRVLWPSLFLGMISITGTFASIATVWEVLSAMDHCPL
jgi:BlaR1 peptidase M56